MSPDTSGSTPAPEDAEAGGSAAPASGAAAGGPGSSRFSVPRPERLLQYLSARSRGEGWEKPEGELAKYRSRGRAAARFVLQRIVFRGVVRANLTASTEVHRRVRTIRGPFVLVANHTSHVDAPLLAQGLPWAQARFLSTGVAADYWFTPFYKRWFVRLLFNAFPIDRDGSRKNSGTSRRLLRSGVPILVFPEGTRQTTGRIGDFKPGGAALAIGVGVPVVPAAIIGGYEAMPKGRNWPKPGRPPVAVVFGEPMIAEEGETAVGFSGRIRASVQDLYDTHHAKILGPTGPGEEETA